MQQQMPPMEGGGATLDTVNVVLRDLNAANEQAWLTLGDIGKMMGDTEQAMRSYGKVVAANPCNIKVRKELINLLIDWSHYYKVYITYKCRNYIYVIYSYRLRM